MKFRRPLALLVIPVVFLLSSCVRMQSDYEILGDDEIRMAVDIGVQNKYIEDKDREDPNLCASNGLVETETLSVEQYVEDGEDGYTGCRQVGTARISDKPENALFNLDDDVWTFSMEGGQGEQMKPDAFTEFNVTVTFPGKVLTHSGTSTVNGTTVTWSDPSDYTDGAGLVATASNSAGLMWLWSLLGVIALFALGVLAFNLRTKNTAAAGPADGSHAPEGRILRRRGGQKFKKSGPHDYGPQVPQDPSSVPKFHHFGSG